MAPLEPHPTLTTPFSARAGLPNTPPLAQYLLSLISIKRSNLCVSADVHTTLELLRVAEEVGDHICILKTHADIIDDWSKDTIAGLQAVAARKHFLLFEDRKFGDIGTTWAHLTNAHLLPGPSIVPTLHAAAQTHLTSLNQSVSTEITAGTPRPSLDEGDFPPSGTDTSTTTITSTDTVTESSAISPTLSPLPSPSEPSNNILFSHRRNPSNSASYTTTITQTSTPLRPLQPPSLMKSVSQSEEEEREEEEQGPSSSSTTLHLNPAQLLADLGPPPHARGLLILAEMSTEGNLMSSEYTATCVKTAQANRDFVLGFVSQRSLNSSTRNNSQERTTRDNFVSLAPGVGLPPESSEAAGSSDVDASKAGASTKPKKSTGDGKGQRWRDPREVVGQDGIDVVIVGRGILGAEDRGREAERYRRRAWEAYEVRIGRRR